MQQQLQFISDADILIGMHGAGLTHAMFLQKHAGVIEFVPNYFSSSNEHFSAISSWRKLHYEKWVNTDMTNELPNDKTIVPPHLMVAIIKGMVKRVCEPHKFVNGSEVAPVEAYFEPKYIESTAPNHESDQFGDRLNMAINPQGEETFRELPNDNNNVWMKYKKANSYQVPVDPTKKSSTVNT